MAFQPLTESIAITLIDLVRYKKKAVGLSHVATVISELKEKVNTKRLPKLADIHDDTLLVQRRLFTRIIWKNERSFTTAMA